MQITVKESLIKSAIGDMLDNSLYDNYPKEVLKKAAAPKRNDLIQQLMADTKFINEVEQYLTEQYSDSDILYDAVCDTKAPLLDKIMDHVDKVEGEMQEQEQAREEAYQVQRMIRTLEDKGYTITKK